MFAFWTVCTRQLDGSRCYTVLGKEFQLKMALEFKKHTKVSLRDTGKDEKWLQDQIAGDPSILGLGELTLFRKEHRQPAGGRVDLLLTDPETEAMYEVEIMLGATDPGHIIRTIEYWDVETRRYRDREHRAVIVAEEITSRFFNVIWLLNRSLPIIAIQLDALEVQGSLLLHFTKILDIYEPEAETAGEELVDRKYWEARSSPTAMDVFDRFVDLLAKHSVDVKLNYRQDGIAFAGKRNFAKITPRKSGYCLLLFFSRLPEEVVRDQRERLELAGVNVQKLSGERFSIRLDRQTLEQSGTLIVDEVRRCLDAAGE